MFFFFFFFFFFFAGLHHSHSNVGSELVCDLYHSSQQCQVLNPLSEARDRICILMDPSQVLKHWAMSEPLYFYCLSWIKDKCLQMKSGEAISLWIHFIKLDTYHVTQAEANMFEYIQSMYIILYLKEIDTDSTLILLAYSRILEQL